MWRKKNKETRRIAFANNSLLNERYVKNQVTNSKYKWWNFVPLNLWEQFGRFMNQYFLLIACLQLWTEITPVDPETTWGPLAFIFLLAALKEGLDDLNRHKGDKKANERMYHIIRDEEPMDVMSKDISVGDILYLEENMESPCDIVLLSSSNEDGSCYIQTANLDGETDLKPRIGLPSTASLGTDEALCSFKGVVECKPPNPDIYVFDSRLKMQPDASEEEILSLSVSQIILQGVHLRNTEYVYGLTVYTGNQSKLGMNKLTPDTKWTKIDKQINRTTLVIFSFQFLCLLIFGITGGVWKTKAGKDKFYLYYPEDERWFQPLVIPLRFMLLMSLMIPISLKVTLDICKYLYASLINWDLEMWDDENEMGAHASNTAISEDLGQIEYIFSDKTGTLTENIMEFKKCSIFGKSYGTKHRNSSALEDPELLKAINEQRPEAILFFKNLALNQSVVPSYKETDSDDEDDLSDSDEEQEIIYKASSPDEEALVVAASKLGIKFTERKTDLLTIVINKKPIQYQLIQTLEFSSERKRMSVLVREVDSRQIFLFTKGADDVILERIRDGQETTKTIRHLERFAKNGLRTLLCGYRTVSEEELEDFLKRFKKASNEIDNRDEALENVFSKFEQDFILLGATAIEDKLQDEVPQTIRILREAGIKFWMLTGDKFSTAVQIAKSCNLMPFDGLLFPIEGGDQAEVENSLDKISEEVQDLDKNFYIIVQGSTLKIALEEVKHKLLNLSLQASSVICCRTTPQQKAGVVQMVKDLGKMTLSIGDGGNDVTMIQTAHVGVGIAGREGLQAVRAADYSISRFKFLRRLMLVHGRYSYYRTTFLAQYSFYKSIFFCVIQLTFNFWTGFSGMSFFNSLSVMTYNGVFTAIPIFFFLLDKDVSEESVYLNPHLYRDSSQGRFYNKKTLFWWFIRAIYQGVLAMVMLAGIYQGRGYIYPSDASGIDNQLLSMTGFTIVIQIQTFTMALETKHWTFYNHFIIWGFLVFFYISTIIANTLPNLEIYYLLFRAYSDPIHWLSCVLINTIVLAPVIIAKYWSAQYIPNRADLVREREVYYRSRGLPINAADATILNNLNSTEGRVIPAYNSSDFGINGIFTPFKDCFGKSDFEELNKKDPLTTLIIENIQNDILKKKTQEVRTQRELEKKRKNVDLNSSNSDDSSNSNSSTTASSTTEDEEDDELNN
ncbi:putative phospholipid-transporting atpase [Anaeramoeba flamelloides]|uniref:Phospholipid-transporting ATPase n=1 Tax=Anaeramoeba flamelloides TaxID=1746091 RepID=A0ABQ8YBK9_9EUKA|nr:putative phospholipid-transporting atpase [Anaeramoeba flamelloides]